MRIAFSLLPILLLLIATIPPANAEAAADPRGFETRVLHDHDDDQYLGAVQDGHDLVALDLREVWDPVEEEDMLVFRLTMDGGHAEVGSSQPTLTETVSFKVNGTEHAFLFETEDNENFTGTFDGIAGPFAAEDADGEAHESRFFVEGGIYHSTIGAAVGDTLTNFTVEGAAGDETVDTMPGNPLDPLGADTVIEEDHTIVGPVHYVDASVEEEEITLVAGEMEVFDLTVTSLLEEHNQTVAVGGLAPEGLAGAIALDEDLDDAMPFLLDPADAQKVLVALQADRAMNGTLVLEVVTSLGGRVVVPVNVSATLPEPEPTPSSDPPERDVPPPVLPEPTETAANESHDHHEADDATRVTGESPGVPLLGMVASATLALAMLRRRL